MLKLQQAGLIEKALESSLSYKNAPDVITNYSSARLEHVSSAVLFLIVGMLASTVFLLLELITAFYKYYKSNLRQSASTSN